VEGIARRGDFDVGQVGPILETTFRAVRVAAMAVQPVTVGRLVRVVPRPDKPTTGRLSLLATPLVGLRDAVAGTAKESVLAADGEWSPIHPVTAAELAKVVAADRECSARLVKEVLEVFETEVVETLRAGTGVHLRGFVSFTLAAKNHIRLPNAALVSVELGPALTALAEQLEQSNLGA
jgi:hypothetical protein